jgi:hypothetical protein
VKDLQLLDFVRFFAEFILSEAEGLRMTGSSLAHFLREYHPWVNEKSVLGQLFLSDRSVEIPPKQDPQIRFRELSLRVKRSNLTYLSEIAAHLPGARNDR